MKDLIERLERATGPDSELDEAIAAKTAEVESLESRLAKAQAQVAKLLG